MTLDAIRQNARELYEAAAVREMLPDLMTKPLSWQVSALGVIAGLAGEKRVLAWAETALPIARAAEGLV